MRRMMVAGNWKMHGSKASVNELVQALLAADMAGSAEVLVCPPSIYLSQVSELLVASDIGLGAQNVESHESGAYTGEIAANMLNDFACAYAIVGHSERRALYGETDAMVAAKFKAVQEAGLTPILCVGETLAQREAGETEIVVTSQVKAVIEAISIDAFNNAVIAYEPVWAIGTGLTATPEQAQNVHQVIRQLLTANNADIGAKTRLLYGGSVKGANAQELFAQQDIDGGLVGGASLQADDFLTICKAAV